MFVVFDTNVYRTFVNGISGEDSLKNINALKQLEAKSDVKALISSTVASELISHILDGDGFDSEGDCTKALRTMYAHSGDAIQYGLVPTPEVQLARNLFKREDSRGIKTDKDIIAIAYQLYNSPTEAAINPYLYNIQSIIKHNKDVEDMMGQYLECLAEQWRKSEDTEASKAIQVKNDHSLAFIIEIAEKHGIQYPKSESYDNLKTVFESHIQIYQKQYPVPLQMIVDFCKKFSDPNFIPNKPERVNQIWDQRILHVAGQCINGEPIILVTDDKAMLEAAKNSVPTVSAANSTFQQIGLTPDAISNNVMRYLDYRAWLESKS